MVVVTDKMVHNSPGGSMATKPKTPTAAAAAKNGQALAELARAAKAKKL
jgi:hypothetical protein